MTDSLLLASQCRIMRVCYSSVAQAWYIFFLCCNIRVFFDSHGLQESHESNICNMFAMIWSCTCCKEQLNNSDVPHRPVWQATRCNRRRWSRLQTSTPLPGCRWQVVWKSTAFLAPAVEMLKNSLFSVPFLADCSSVRLLVLSLFDFSLFVPCFTVPLPFFQSPHIGSFSTRLPWTIVLMKPFVSCFGHGFVTWQTTVE